MDELKRRALASIETDVVVLAGGNVRRWDGVTAGFVPAAADRSIFNGVGYSDPVALAATIDEAEAAYADAGVGAWTVWVPDEDRTSAELLEGRGHVLDGAPRAMSLWLEDLAEGPPPIEGVRPGAGTAADVGHINDIAYETPGPGFGASLGQDGGVEADWHFAAAGDELVCCLGTVSVGDDVLVTCVATLPDWRGRGIAGWLLRRALAYAREGGARSASLRASALGAGVYARLGFIDHGYVELWEKRAA